MEKLIPPVKSELFDAIHDGDFARVEALLACGADPNEKGRNGVVPLVSAATGGHADIVNLLLDHGAEINAKNRERFNALNAAIIPFHVQAGVVRVLVERGAPLDDRLSRGNTALMQAVYARNAEVVQLLVDGLADLERKNGGYTALELAQNQGFDEIVSILEAAPARQTQIRQERAEAQQFREMHNKTADKQALLQKRAMAARRLRPRGL